MKFSHSLYAATLSSLLVACQNVPHNETSLNSQASATPQVSQDSTTDQATQLHALFKDYQEKSFQFSPISATFQGLREYNDQFGPAISQQNRDRQLAFEKKYLNLLKTIKFNQLSAQDQLSYRVFEGERLQSVEGRQYPFHLMPINQMSGMHNFYAVLGSGQSAQPFKNEQDYRNFIKRSQGFALWMASVVESMKNGQQQGIVLPEPIVKKLIPQLKVHIVDKVEDSVFYTPLKSLPKDLTEKQKNKLMADYTDMIKQVIIPAYKNTHDFIVNQYQSSARQSVGLSEIPGGKEWYEFLIKVHTTLPLTAEEIHQFGLNEVARILSEMNKVKQQVGFNGDLASFFEFLRTDDQFYFDKPEELIQAYENIKSRIDATLPKLFEVFPKADYVVKAVADFQAASAPAASYQSPSPDGSRPGIFYINTYNLKSQPKFLMESLSIHEAAPGHHFQEAIQQETTGLPDFRKFGSHTVFNEGWALYAESLGKELGLFTDPYMWYGRLVDEQLRAMRLVVDTGLHAFGWTREQAIQYMLDNSSMARSDVEAEVERYIVIAGQALAYKVGQRKIRELRSKGEQLLGDKFDIKKFHTQVLIDGSLPMPILEDKMMAWFKSQM
jgi:uncharacterized protein (DUF885 family)